jgi:hypothetical protein
MALVIWSRRVTVKFFISLGEKNFSDEIYGQMLAGNSQSRVTKCDSVLPHAHCQSNTKKFSVV